MKKLNYQNKKKDDSGSTVCTLKVQVYVQLSKSDAVFYM